MKDIILVVLTAATAHGIVWCWGQMAGWRQRGEDDPAASVAEFNLAYRVEVTEKESIVYAGWMAPGK